MAQSIITQITPINQQDQLLNPTDNTLVTSISTDSSFNIETDIIEAFVYDINNILIRSINTNYTVQNTSINDNEIKELFIDPVSDLENSTFNIGVYNINYNFLRNK
jgi:nitrogenase subunit NifH